MEDTGKLPRVLSWATGWWVHVSFPARAGFKKGEQYVGGLTFGHTLFLGLSKSS